MKSCEKPFNLDFFDSRLWRQLLVSLYLKIQMLEMWLNMTYSFLFSIWLHRTGSFQVFLTMTSWHQATLRSTWLAALFKKKVVYFRFGQISNSDQASNNKAGTKKLLETNFLGNQSLRQTVQLLTTQLDFIHLATVEIHLVVEHLILLLELLVVVAHLHDKVAYFDLLVQ